MASEFSGKSPRIFLTGATGVLGARLLKELLLTTDSPIDCLVRADDEAHARERLATFLRIYDPELELAEAFAARVTPVRGDISSENLGLSADEYAALRARTDLTVHSAANTSLLAKYKRIEPVNVGGARNVIEFVLGTAEKRLSYVSTYTVMGTKTFDSSLRFSEDHYDVGQTFEHMNYQQSKFLAEGLVREATSRGLRWKIFRPGQIFGESGTGYYPQGDTQVSGLFYDIFKTIIETGVAFHSATHFDVVPVDYVAQGIVALSLRREEWFEVYHLTNPDIKTFSEVVALFTRDYRCDWVSEERYKEMLQNREILARDGESYSSATLMAFSVWFFRAGISFEESAVTDCEATVAKLRPLGVECAKLDEELVETYLRHGIRQGYFPTAAAARAADGRATASLGTRRDAAITSVDATAGAPSL